MRTSQRLGIDITATNKTAAAFASVQKSMSGIERSLRSVKFLMAGFFSGNVLAGMVRNFVEVSKQSAPVKTAIENLQRAWYGFSQQVGESGMNDALISFANRMGALILSTDGLSRSIGAFMTGAINGMSFLFEGVGRSIAFVYDNMEILSRIIASLALAMLARNVIGVAVAFYNWAATVKATGLIMTAFHAITRSNLYVWLALGAGIAYATDSLDTLRAGLDTIWQKVREVFPEIAKAGAEMAEGFGFDLKALTTDLNDATSYIEKLRDINMPDLSKKEVIKPNTLADIYGAGKAVTAMRDSFDTQVAGAKSALEELRASMTDFTGAGKTALMNFGAGLEDVFVKFAQGGKLSFKDLIDTMIADLARLSYKMAMSGLFDAFTGKNTGGNQIADIVGGVLRTILGGGSVSPSQHAMGGVFSNSIVSRPTAFAYGGANLGIMGEAGPEAIMPLKRGPDGKLGVSGGRGAAPVVVKHTVINYSGAKIEQQERTGPNGERELLTIIDRRMAAQIGNPYSPASSALDARGARVATKRR